ncbi:MAG: hypothetical protein AAGC64_12870 [Bacteroidota bacterium]
MKFYLISSSLIICTFSYSQSQITIPYSTYYECDQEYGLYREKGEYVLTIEYDEDTLRWRADDAFQLDLCEIKKKTEKYIVGLSADGTRVFYEVADQRFFYLIRWEATYTAYGIGKGSLALRETVSHMIQIIESGGKEEDVLAFLIRQAAYDF